MGFFPYERFTIKTNLSPNEAKERLLDRIEVPELFWNQFSVTRKLFRGNIVDNEFKIMRIIEGKNSFLPVITGKIEQGAITITMRLHIFIMIFMLFGLGLTGFIVLVMLSKKGISVLVLIPLIMIIIGYLLSTWAFKSEVVKSKVILEESFK